MNEPILQSGWDTVFYALPMLAMLLASLFGLDECLSGPKNRRTGRYRAQPRPFERGAMACDPDGRPWPSRGRVNYSGSSTTEENSPAGFNRRGAAGYRVEDRSDMRQKINELPKLTSRQNRLIPTPRG